MHLVGAQMYLVSCIYKFRFNSIFQSTDDVCLACVFSFVVFNIFLSRKNNICLFVTES